MSYEMLEFLKQLNNKLINLRWEVQGMDDTELSKFNYNNKVEPKFFDMQKDIFLQIKELETKLFN